VDCRIVAGEEDGEFLCSYVSEGALEELCRRVRIALLVCNIPAPLWDFGTGIAENTLRYSASIHWLWSLVSRGELFGRYSKNQCS